MFRIINQYLSVVNVSADQNFKATTEIFLSDRKDIKKFCINENYNKYIIDIKMDKYSVESADELFRELVKAVEFSYSSIFVRYNEAISIIHKVQSFKEKTVSELVGTRNPFGLSSAARGSEYEDEILLYSSGGKGYIPKNIITQGNDIINKYKVMISKVTSEHAGEPDKSGMFTVISTTRVLSPNEVCTDSYLVAFVSDTENEAINFAKYLCSKFFRFLLLQAVSSINLSKDKFQFIPIQDFSQEWNDELLYKKYSLSKEEIDFIESMIKPKELGGE